MGGRRPPHVLLYYGACGSPKNFSLEQRKIEQTYWNLQKRLHPDLYGSKSEVRASELWLAAVVGIKGSRYCWCCCSLRKSCRPRTLR